LLFGLAKKFKRIFVVLTVVVLFVSAISIFLSIFKALYPIKYKDSVIRYCNEYQLDPYLVLSMIKAESNFKERALSHKNAKGLMQITEKTGVWAAQKMDIENFKVEDLYDPDTNIRIGCWYINYLEKQFENNKNGRSEEENTELVIASYNGGIGNVRKWVENLEKNGYEFYEFIPFNETKKYLKRVKNNYYIYSKLYKEI